MENEEEDVTPGLNDEYSGKELEGAQTPAKAIESCVNCTADNHFECTGCRCHADY